MNDIPFTAAGNLTRDPELRSTQGGPVTVLTIAITPRHLDRRSGSWADGETTFLDASVWGPMAGHVSDSLSQGDRVIVLGRLATRSFTPQSGKHQGETVRKLEVVVDEVGPSLRWATAEVTKAAKDPDESPF